MDQREIDKLEEEAIKLADRQKELGESAIVAAKAFEALGGAINKIKYGGKPRKRGKGYTRANKDQSKKKRLMAKQSKRINRHKWYKTKCQRV